MTSAHGYAVVLATSGAGLILAERRRQVDDEGWTAEHDDQHTEQQVGAMTRDQPPLRDTTREEMAERIAATGYPAGAFAVQLPAEPEPDGGESDG